MSSLTPAQPPTLGLRLQKARADAGMSLRQVEAATGGTVSNAYLCQLESGKIKQPSPHVLYDLSLALGVPYGTLMECAGYIPVARQAPTSGPSPTTAARAALRVLAEKATPGEWKRKGLIITTQRGLIASIPVPQDGGCFDCNENAAFIAAANPAAIIELLDELAAARAVIRNAATLIRSNTDDAVEQAWHRDARAHLGGPASAPAELRLGKQARKEG